MASYSGIYLGYEGTTAQCNLKQRPRETVYDTDSGLMRYMTSNSGIVYFNVYDPSVMTSGYLPKWEGASLRNSIISDSGSYADINGNLSLIVPACPVNVDKFLVYSGNFIQYRTGAELLSDIGTGLVLGTGVSGYITRWDSASGIVNTANLESGGEFLIRETTRIQYVTSGPTWNDGIVLNSNGILSSLKGIFGSSYGSVNPLLLYLSSKNAENIIYSHEGSSTTPNYDINTVYKFSDALTGEDIAAKIQVEVGDYWFNGASINKVADIVWYTSLSGVVGEKMRLNSSGNLDLVGSLSVTAINNIGNTASRSLLVSSGTIIGTGNASSIGLIISGYANQTAHLQTWTDYSGNILSRIQANGRIYAGAGLYSDCLEAGAGLVMFPHEGVQIQHDLTSNSASYDYTGGEYEQYMSDPSGIFTSGDVGNWIVVRTGDYKGAMAHITEYISSSGVILHTMGWHFDISNFGYYIIEQPEVVIGDGYHMEFNANGDGHFDIHSSNWSGNLYTNNLFESELDAGLSQLRAGLFKAEANGYGDITALYADYIAGPIDSGVVGAGITSRIQSRDTTYADSTTEIMAFRARAVNETDATMIAYRAAPGFDYAFQVQGATAIDPDYGYNVVDATANVYDRVTGTPTSGTAFLDSSVDDVTLFNAVNDYILIGSSGTFEIIEVDLSTVSSKSIVPVFEYSTGDGTWATLSVLADSTLGFQQDGQISFIAPIDWAVGETAETASDITSAYYVRITRSYAPVISVKPIEDHFKIYESRGTGFNIRGNGTMQPVSLADGGAQNDSIYYSTTQSALVYKDSVGSVHALY